jgi:hypothetical protein
MRRQEGPRSFTNALRLKFPYQGEDFKLEIWLYFETGDAISQAISSLNTAVGSDEAFRRLLGDYLFEAVKTSNWGKVKEKRGISSFTGAIDVSQSGDNRSDCKVTMTLNFEKGFQVHKDIYLHVISQIEMFFFCK